MPLSEEQKSAIATLEGVPSEDIAEAVDILKGKPLYQKIFGAGHLTGKNAGKSDKDSLETQLTEARERVTALESEVETLKEKTPDRGAIDAGWQAKLDREVGKVQAKLDAAQAKVARLTTDTTVEKAENALKDAGFRPRVARLIAREAAGRIEYDENGNPVLYEGEGASRIPVSIPEGKTAFAVLADNERKVADPADLRSDADSGGGVSGGNASGKPSADEYRKATESTVNYVI